MGKWQYIAVVMVLVAIEAGAQERRVLSRAELDALVNPTLSTTAQGSIIAEPATRNMGEVADTDKVIAYFTLRNTTAEAIEVTVVRSSCSCLKVTTPITRIEADESIALRAEFNPTGRNGGFSIPILLYTALDDAHPTARLTVEGSVVATDEWSHLTYRMGSLRLSRKSVSFDCDTRTERIAVANVSNAPLRLSSQPTTEGIALRTEPEVLMPGEEGDIVITYAPTADMMHDIETAIIVEGCGEARPSERMIRITIKH
ncbi:MAG: DUF1573 domain-containing protein [Alistipes sp.]|nr:DUF1573 domain-containing protein [Alistipes sp.]